MSKIAQKSNLVPVLLGVAALYLILNSGPTKQPPLTEPGDTLPGKGSQDGTAMAGTAEYKKWVRTVPMYS